MIKWKKLNKKVTETYWEILMESLVFLLFCSILVACIIIKISIVFALFAGLVLFLVYGRIKGFSYKDLYSMCLSSIKSVSNILIIFVLIGILTALWRASGCITAIVYYASGIIRPSIFIILTFLLNAAVSTLIGTAFGTAATMGVICMSIANSMGISAFWICGAILSGIYFGDRISPVSGSALLVSALTKTELYSNIKNMLHSCIIPFMITCIIYIIAGLSIPTANINLSVVRIFEEEFSINLLCLLPAVSIIFLALLKTDVKKTMLASILISIPLAVFVQNISIVELIKITTVGYHAKFTELAPMINGGGIMSMVKVSIIVCISSCYSGTFDATGLLDFIKNYINKIAQKIGSYPAVVMLSLPISAISCNQTLAIMLTHQLSSNVEKNKSKLALYLEDSVVITSSLIPWSIASTVPMDSTGAPLICVLAACYIYILPIFNSFSKDIVLHNFKHVPNAKKI